MLNDDQVNEILSHYGVKGMRWGVRKKRSESRDRRPLTSARKKSVKSLSDKQLRSAIARMRLEREYKSLKQASKKLNAGKKLIGGILTGVATKTAINYINAKAPGAIKRVSDAILDAMASGIKIKF